MLGSLCFIIVSLWSFLIQYIWMQFAFGGSLCRDDGRNGEQGAMTYHGTLQSKSIQVNEGPLHFPGIICHFWSHVGKEACSRWIFHQLLPGSGFFMRVKQRHTGSSLCPQPGLGAQSQPVHVGKQKCTLRNTLASSTTVFYLSHINNEGIYRKGGWGGRAYTLRTSELVHSSSLHPNNCLWHE